MSLSLMQHFEMVRFQCEFNIPPHSFCFYILYLFIYFLQNGVDVRRDKVLAACSFLLD